MLQLKASTVARSWQQGGERPHQYEVDYTELLCSGSFGYVYGGNLQGKKVAVKVFHAWDDDEDDRIASVLDEVMRYVMVQSHSNILKLLDIEIFDYERYDKSLTMNGIGLVYERYDTDVERFLRKRPLKDAGIRHVLRSAVVALEHLHKLGFIYMNLRPSKMLLRGEGPFRRGWQRLCREREPAFSACTNDVSADGLPAQVGGCDESCELTYQLGSCFKVYFLL
jgi:serine/threonine protein kinase